MWSSAGSSDDWDLPHRQRYSGPSDRFRPPQRPSQSRTASQWAAYSTAGQSHIHAPRQPTPRYSRPATPAANIPLQPQYNGRGRRYHTPTSHAYDEHIKPPLVYAPPPSRPRMDSSSASRKNSFVKSTRPAPPTIKVALERPQQTATFECILQRLGHQRTQIAPSEPALLQKRNGVKYCLGSLKNSEAVRQYIRDQMSAIVQLYHEDGVRFQFGDSVKVQFLPSGRDVCGVGGTTSCGKRCGRRVLLADQLIAVYDPIRVTPS